MTPCVTILLAAYNSEKYLQEQLNSLLSQRYENFRILISDGGSTDSTVKICQEYEVRFPEKISLLVSGERLSCGENFLYLLRHCETPYAMFSDHDDVWLPDKVSAEMKEMLAAEGQNPGKPVLVYTDLCICDHRLNVMAESLFCKWGVPEHKEHNVAALTTYPVTSGCSFLMNRALFGTIHDLPLQEYPYYDLLIALKNYLSGGIFVYCKGKFILHRLHGGNLSELNQASSFWLLRKLKVLRNLANEKIKFRGLLTAVAKMCQTVENPPEDAAVCRKMLEAGVLRRIYLMFKVWGKKTPWKILVQKIPLLFF